MWDHVAPVLTPRLLERCAHEPSIYQLLPTRWIDPIGEDEQLVAGSFDGIALVLLTRRDHGPLIERLSGVE